MSRARGKLTKSEQMARVQSRHTAPECALREALWRTGLRYRLHTKSPGTPDVVLVTARLAVFVDGCFWHGCLEHYSAPVANAALWRAKVARNLERDRRVDEELRACGWTPLRGWEHAVNKTLDATVRIVAATLAERQGAARPAFSKGKAGKRQRTRNGKSAKAR